MTLNRVFASLILLLFACPIFAQEVCDNGIDDDGDGMIDLNDPECACNGIDIIVPASLFPNPSFEINNCRPGIGKANCAEGWVNPSEASPDYYDRCDVSISSVIPIAPCPMPQGDKCFGITDIFSNSLTRKEYVGTRLTSALEAGEDYILSFWVGFVQTPHNSFTSPTTNFAVFGNTRGDVINVPFDGLDCPTNATVDSFGTLINPWQELLVSRIEDVNDDGWEQVRIEFTPAFDFEAILIGPSCVRSPGANYYFLDNLVLSRRDEFSTDFIVVSSGSACNNDMVLGVPDLTDDMNISYQWYKDNVALVGETNVNYTVEPLPMGNGNYVCVISNAFGCMMSDAFVIDENKPEVAFDAPTGICPGTRVRIGLQDNYASYEWANGLGNSDAIMVSQPDDYQVTVVDNNGCEAIGTYTLSEYVDVQYTRSVSEESAPGAQDGSITINHESGVSNPAVRWADGSSDNPYAGLREDIYCVTITADERCPVEDCIDLELEIQPIIIGRSIVPVRCHGESNGQIEIEISGGLAPFDLRWENHPEWDDQLSISSLEAGIYSLTLTDGEGTVISEEFEVGTPDLLEAELIATAPTCNGLADGSTRIANVRGGNGGYEYSWNGQPFNATEGLDNLRGGAQRVIVRDVLGCELMLTENIREPNPIGAVIEIDHAYCDGADDGMLFIDEITGGTAPYEVFIDGRSADLDIFDLKGEQSYDLRIQDINGCTFNQELYVANQLDFTVDLGEAQTIEEFYETRVEARSNHPIIIYDWSVSAGQPINCTDCQRISLPVEEDIQVVLYATTAEGCVASDTLQISMTPSKRIYIPNAFSPNNDGINDAFRLYNANEVELINHFRVYNRGGVKIFDVQNVNQETVEELWSDTVNNRDVDGGTYVYTASLQFKDGEIIR